MTTDAREAAARGPADPGALDPKALDVRAIDVRAIDVRALDVRAIGLGVGDGRALGLGVGDLGVGGSIEADATVDVTVDAMTWPIDVRQAVLVGDGLGISPQVCRGAWSSLSPVVAHGLARLRVDVLVTEAGRARSELDDADLDPATEHLWVPDGEQPVACLRVVRGAGGVPVIDRACARPDVRRLGLVSALVTDVIARRGAGPVRALAPPGTVAFFTRHGFEVSGPPLEASGARVAPMLRHPEHPWRD